MSANLWEMCAESPEDALKYIKRKSLFVDDEIALRLDHPLDPPAQQLIRALLECAWVVYDHLVVWILSDSVTSAIRRLKNLAAAWEQPPVASKLSRGDLGVYYEHLLAEAAKYSMSLQPTDKTYAQIANARAGIHDYFRRGTDTVVAEAFSLIPLLGGFGSVPAAFSGVTDVAVALALYASNPKAVSYYNTASLLKLGTWLGRLIGAAEGSIAWKLLARVRPAATGSDVDAADAADAMDTDAAELSATRCSTIVEYSPAQCLRSG